MKERARELKASADGEGEVLAKIAEMPQPDRELATGFHELVLATPRASPTARNLLRAGAPRIGVGPPRDVVLVDGPVSEGVDEATADAHAEHAGFDQRSEPNEYVYLRVTPSEIRAWREANELTGRLIMRDGTWLP